MRMIDIERWRDACQTAPQPFSLAWAAGFVDGEGCIHVVKQRYLQSDRNTTYRLRFCITQNNREVLEHFANGLGVAGHLYRTKRQVAHNKQIYVLTYDGRHAMEVIGRLKPYLVRKQMEACVAETFWTEGLAGQRSGPRGWPPEVIELRERCYWKLRNLK